MQTVRYRLPIDRVSLRVPRPIASLVTLCKIQNTEREYQTVDTEPFCFIDRAVSFRVKTNNALDIIGKKVVGEHTCRSMSIVIVQFGLQIDRIRIARTRRIPSSSDNRLKILEKFDLNERNGYCCECVSRVLAPSFKGKRFTNDISSGDDQFKWD